MSQEYALYGIYVDYAQDGPDGGYVEVETRELVARFSSEPKADAYVRRSRLKSPRRQSFAGLLPFRQASLLRRYSYAVIEEYCPESPPTLDPTI